MAIKYLMDTNVIIHYLGKKLTLQQAEFVKNIPVNISIVSRIELMGRYNATKQHMQTISAYLRSATIYELNEKIILQTIDIRQKHKIELPDAIIAATAMANKLTLITHDIHDFKHISNLKLIDSWSI